MTAPTKGGPAFPTQTVDKFLHGMTLRDYFAGQALVALISAEESFVAGFDGPRVTEAAYAVADAMLAARAEVQS